MEKWTIKDMPDMSGKTIIVTGGNSGIGFEAAKAFVSKNANVIIACRDLEKGKAAIEVIKKDFSNALLEALWLDLSIIESIKAFVFKFKSTHTKLDILVNNAGVMYGAYSLTNDGFERQFGTNHLGHFALTALLFDLIKNTPNSRIITISSIAHRRGNLDFSNLQYEKPNSYNEVAAYSRSKLANLMFSYELGRRLEKHHLDVKAVAAHPGISKTNLFAPNFKNKKLYNFLFKLAPIQSALMGALPTLRAASDPLVKNGEYYGPQNLNEVRGYPIPVGSKPQSWDLEASKKLWEVSEQLTKIKFTI